MIDKCIALIHNSIFPTWGSTTAHSVRRLAAYIVGRPRLPLVFLWSAVKGLKKGFRNVSVSSHHTDNEILESNCVNILNDDKWVGGFFVLILWNELHVKLPWLALSIDRVTATLNAVIKLVFAKSRSAAQPRRPSGPAAWSPSGPYFNHFNLDPFFRCMLLSEKRCHSLLLRLFTEHDKKEAIL